MTLAASILMFASCDAIRLANNTYYAEDDKDNYDSGLVNIGYGSASKEKVSTSVNQVEVKEKEAVSYTNIFDYLKSRVPGLDVKSDGTLRIRGVTSVNSSVDPLILVDGVEYRDISSISPADVKSVSVLKDASASIYGVRGANGVILITTK